jgi:uncharacterized protein YqjF (DUF2071 family)
VTPGYPHDVQAAARQKKALETIDHRPWPLPEEEDGWVMGQTWERLLFAHWRVPEDQLREVVHPKIPIDTFDGSAWIGITPFTVAGLHARGTPPPPIAASFHEINVRTYATIDDKPGIYFLSLDAASRAAVHAARSGYRVPYFHADIEAEPVEGEPVEGDGGDGGDGDRIRYHSERKQDPPAAFEAEYGPTGKPFNAEPGSFEHWATERYCLYTLAEQRVQRGEIHHPPWPLQQATADIVRNTMTAPYGIDLEGEPILHYAERQDVVFWPLTFAAP